MQTESVDNQLPDIARSPEKNTHEVEINTSTPIAEPVPGHNIGATSQPADPAGKAVHAHSDTAANISGAAIPVNTYAAPGIVQTSSLVIGAPGDRYEQEADRIASEVTGKSKTGWAIPPDTHTPAAGSVQRIENDDERPAVQTVAEPGTSLTSPDGSLATSPDFSARLNGVGPGSPLSETVKTQMEPAMSADFSNVRIHTDSAASSLSRSISAQAFTHENHIYFNEGEYAPETTEGQFLLAHELTHTIQQGAAIQRQPVSTGAVPQVQRSWLGDTLNSFSGYIPGFTLFTVIIGFNPLTGDLVQRNAVNLLRGLMGLVPVVGELIFQELQTRGVLDQAFTWVSEELRRLDLTRARFERLLNEAASGIAEALLGPVDYFDGLFGSLYRSVIAFAESLKNELLRMIKNALVAVLKTLAIDRLPAYRLLTKILHRDPLTGEQVPATTAEILTDFLRMIGKEEELRQMQERGTLQRTADWLDQQIGQFLSLFDQLLGIFNRAWEAFSFESLRNPLQVLEGIVTDFTAFVGRVFNYALTVAVQVLQFIKDALLGWLRGHANGIRGYRLMTVLLGRDPVTGEGVERNARNILSGFVELVAGQETFQRVEESGAIERLASWLEATADRLGITFDMIRQLFTGIWDMLTINDLAQPVEAFGRVMERFGDKIARVIAFLVEVIMKVIEIVLDIMQVPIDVAQQIIQRVVAAYETIKQDPMAFFINLLRAVKQGFVQFFDKIGEYLLQGVTGWLMSELATAGIRPPRDFTLRSVIGFVFDVLGITMDRIWQKLAEHPSIGPERVARIRGMINQLTGIWTIIQEVIQEGPGALWRHLQEQLSNLWGMVLEQIRNWITERIVSQVVQRLLSMLDPTGIMAVIRSVEAMYRAVQSFIQRLREIMNIINSFVGGILEIAQGNITTAANYLERTMAGAIPTIIGFLANQIGLGGLGRQIGEMIGRVRELVDRGLTWLVGRLVAMGRSLLEMGRNALRRTDNRTPQEKQEALNTAVAAIQPQVQQMLRNGPPGRLFKLRLAYWKLRYRLSSLQIEPNGEIKATINPTAIIDTLTPLHRQQLYSIVLNEVQNFGQLEHERAQTAAAVLGSGTGQRDSPLILNSEGNSPLHGYQASTGNMSGETTVSAHTQGGNPVPSILWRPATNFVVNQGAVYRYDPTTDTRDDLGRYPRSGEIPGISQAPPVSGATAADRIIDSFDGNESRAAEIILESLGGGELPENLSGRQTQTVAATTHLIYLEGIRNPTALVSIVAELERVARRRVSLRNALGGAVAARGSVQDFRTAAFAASRFNPQTGQIGEPIMNDPHPRGVRADRRGSEVRAAAHINRSIEAIVEIFLQDMAIDGQIYIKSEDQITAIRAKIRELLVRTYGRRN